MDTSKITIVNTLAEPSIDLQENPFLKRLKEKKEVYEVDDQNGEPGLLAGKIINTFSELFQSTYTRRKFGESPFRTAPLVEMGKDPILQELEKEGLNSEPLEIILSGFANHVNSCVGRLLEKQKELEAIAISLEQEILHMILPKFNARYHAVKAMAEQSRQLKDIASIAKSTREEFDKSIASIIVVQSKLPPHLRLTESEKMSKKYPLLSQYVGQQFSPLASSSIKNKDPE